VILVAFLAAFCLQISVVNAYNEVSKDTQAIETNVTSPRHPHHHNHRNLYRHANVSRIGKRDCTYLPGAKDIFGADVKVATRGALKALNEAMVHRLAYRIGDWQKSQKTLEDALEEGDDKDCCLKCYIVAGKAFGGTLSDFSAALQKDYTYMRDIIRGELVDEEPPSNDLYVLKHWELRSLKNTDKKSADFFRLAAAKPGYVNSEDKTYRSAMKAFALSQNEEFNVAVSTVTTFLGFSHDITEADLRAKTYYSYDEPVMEGSEIKTTIKIQNFWLHHAFAHGHFYSGTDVATSHGLDFLSTAAKIWPDDKDDTHPFLFTHLTWHKAILAMEKETKAGDYKYDSVDCKKTKDLLAEIIGAYQDGTKDYEVICNINGLTTKAKIYGCKNAEFKENSVKLEEASFKRSTLSENLYVVVAALFDDDPVAAVTAIPSNKNIAMRDAGLAYAKAKAGNFANDEKNEACVGALKEINKSYDKDISGGSHEQKLLFGEFIMFGLKQCKDDTEYYKEIATELCKVRKTGMWGANFGGEGCT